MTFNEQNVKIRKIALTEIPIRALVRIHGD